MSKTELFETETMAELCARQGRLGEAIAIYRRLDETTAPSETRARWKARLAELEHTWHPSHLTEVKAANLPLPASPGVTVVASDDQVTIAWALPPETQSPALELLLVQRTSAGIETIKKTLPITSASGRIGLAATDVHSALAAVGTIVEGRFCPIARSART